MAEVSPIIERKVRCVLTDDKTHTVSVHVSFMQVVSIYTVHGNRSSQRT